MTCFYCKVPQRVCSLFYSLKMKQDALVGALLRNEYVCVFQSKLLPNGKKKMFQHQYSLRSEQKAKISTKIFFYGQAHPKSFAFPCTNILLGTSPVDLETSSPWPGAGTESISVIQTAHHQAFCRLSTDVAKGSQICPSIPGSFPVLSSEGGCFLAAQSA